MHFNETTHFTAYFRSLYYIIVYILCKIILYKYPNPRNNNNIYIYLPAVKKMKHFIVVCEDCSDAGSEEGVNAEMYTID
jgi:hypothetical protein